MYVKVFIGYIRLELDLQDFKALACQKELSALWTTTSPEGLNPILVYRSYACVSKHAL